MAFYQKDDLKQLYAESKSEQAVWQQDYPEYERLMDNGLMDALDPNLPEVNDGSLAAALFKLPKRIVSKKLSGTVKAVDRDEAWLSELANLQWRNEIIPNANSQAPFHRKLKDAVRKAAGYGSIPLITLLIHKNGKQVVDFLAAQPQDVALEAGKVSDLDSDVIFWDVYFTKLQVENMIEQAKEEVKEAKNSGKDGYNKWDIPVLEEILEENATEQRTDQNRSSDDGKAVRPSGIKFFIAFQRGVDAPFYMYHSSKEDPVREWTNPDPTGDIPVHYFYCYQDFKNPYGVGIVKLAGGTQNVLDYMRQADVLGTQIGLRPPIKVAGNADEVDFDSLVYAQDAIWEVGNADVKRENLDNGIYQQLPERIGMYKTSLNQLIPTGDTTIAAGSGDPQYSKTPAGVKFQAASLSIDDEDFKDNLYVTYAAVAKSMINTKFACMEGTDLLKLSDDERDILIKAGLEFPANEAGEISNQAEIQWDTVRAQFDFEVDPETDKAKDDADKREGLTSIAEFLSNPNTANLIQNGGQPIILGNKKIDPGELVAEWISLTTDNDKIISDYTPEEQAEDQANAGAVAPTQGQMPMDQLPPDQAAVEPAMPEPVPADPSRPSPEEMQANIQAIMEQYGVSEETAITALAAEHEGLPIEAIMAKLQEEATV